MSKEKIPVLISGSSMRDGKGNLTGIILSAKDERDSKLVMKLREAQSLLLQEVSTTKTAAKETQKRAKELEKAHKELKNTQFKLVQSSKLASLGVMSSGLAHELNTPLQSIMGFNQRLVAYFERNEQATLKDVEKYTQKIDKNCHRMKEIIQHFRDFSRQDKQFFRNISVNKVIGDSFILFKEQLRLHNIRIDMNLCKNDPKVNGDSNRLEQVFSNLISNSRDAITCISHQQGLLSVSSKIEDDSVVVDFSDNGPGIEKSKLDHIFDPFYTTKEVGKGTGLGLSISYEIIQNHKGNISCLINLDKGAIFRITLPLSSEE